ILAVFGRSTKACPRHDFRHSGVDQQYPPLKSTVPQYAAIARTAYTKTHDLRRGKVILASVLDRDALTATCAVVLAQLRAMARPSGPNVRPQRLQLSPQRPTSCARVECV